ncbi:MAG TPA: hypothetical protein VMG30_05680 [Acidobacteriota bacterium]|nr:hypothetical protein [Acidobacteriota bacterium]
MRKSFVVVLLLLPVLAWAQSPIDGTWKVDLDNAQIQEKPTVEVLLNGTYQCVSCDPKINIKADGADQPAPPEWKAYDKVAIKVVDNKTIEFARKKGASFLLLETITVSADGKMRTVDSTATVNPGAGQESLKFKSTQIRVAAGPAGSHEISGTWRVQKMNYPQKEMMVTYKSTPNGLTMLWETGQSFDANFDGKDYPVKGGAEGAAVSLKKVNDRSVDLINKRDGKIVAVTHITVSTDGKTLTMRTEEIQEGGTFTLTGTKQ